MTSAHSTPRQHGSRASSAPAAGSDAEPMAEAALRPVTLWLGLPLLARLEAFAEPLLLAAAEATAAAAEAAAAAAGQQQRGQRVAFEPPQGGRQPPAAARKTAVAAAIDSILDSLQVQASALYTSVRNHVSHETDNLTTLQLHDCLFEVDPLLPRCRSSGRTGSRRCPRLRTAALACPSQRRTCVLCWRCRRRSAVLPATACCMGTATWRWTCFR